MRALLSTIGTRGDVQPVVALALELLSLGQQVRVCAPPDFREWVEDLGISFVSVGPEVRAFAAAPRLPPTPGELRQMLAGTVAEQFRKLDAAARDCDLIVGCNGIQVAARSLAERLGIPYVFTAYCPVSLPSQHHAPPPMLGQKPADACVDNTNLWEDHARRSNAMWADALNTRRTEAGQPPVSDVFRHVVTARPWLAADPVLAPWPAGEDVVQTGAWILPDTRALSDELLAFLADGEPPVYVGFGSVRAPQGSSQAAIEAARAAGRRVLVQRGWAELALIDAQPDCLSIGEVNQQALFERVAAVIHHGGAGTITAAARAGVPQVVLPQHYDQPYWARQVERLGVGVAHASAGSLHEALRLALAPELVARARVVAGQVRTDGASIAARRLLALTCGA